MGSGALGNSGISGGNATDATITFSDIMIGNVSTAKHGFAPKAPNDATKFLNGLGAYSVPAGGGSSFLTDITSNIIWCVAGGSYANGQAAIDAASSGQTIVMGYKSGGWGDLVFPVGKKLNLVGLAGDRNITIEVKSITFSPSTGSDPNINQVVINNIYVNQTTGTSSAVVFGGTAPARLRMYNCYINASNGSATLISSANSGSGSSFYLVNCNIDSGSSGTRTGLTNSTYLFMRNTQMSGGTKAISNTAGTLDIGFSAIECNQVNEVINLSGGAAYIGSTSITNTTTNGSGFLMASPAFLSLGNSGFAVNTGTGYCLRGTGTVFYDRYIFSDTVALAQNKKVQNTLTIFQYTSTASVVA